MRQNCSQMSWLGSVVFALLAFSNSPFQIKGLSLPCGGTKNGNQGVIKSPNYPQNYPDNLECTWRIIGPVGHTLQLTFLHFVLERNTHCSNDFVRVYDGGSTKSNMIGKYCGGMRPFTVLATSNQMTVLFKSDSSVSFSGLKAKFVAVSKGPHTTAAATSIPTASTTKSSSTALTVTTFPETTTTTTTMASSTKLTTTTKMTTIPITTATTTIATIPSTPRPIFFAKPLKRVTVCVKGNTCRFICTVRGTKKRVSIHWSKDSRPLLGDPTGIHVDIVKKNKKRSILIIRNVVTSDSGLYGCHAKDPNSGKVIDLYGQLSVHAPKPTPTLPTLQPPTIVKANLNATIEINGKVELSCEANGTEPLTIRWYRNLIPYLHGKVKQLQYKNHYKSTITIQLMDNNPIKVQCEVQNNLGIVSKRGLVRAIEKLAAPDEKPVAITMATLNLTGEIGDAIILRCAANGAPPVSMRWLVDNMYYEGKQTSYKDNFTSSFTLIIRKKFTVVKCEAQNPYGIDSKSGIISIKPAIEARKADPWDSFQPGHKMFYIVVAAGIAFLILLFLGIVFVRRKVANPRYKAPELISLEQLTTNPIFERSSNTYINPRIERWDVPRNNIEFIKDIENGMFSRLFMGRMTNASRGEQDALVHVKVLKESTQLDSNKEAFEAEAIELTNFDHPNVQSLVGVCVTGRPLCLVFECSDRGDLNQFLRDSGCSHYIVRERPNSSLDPDTKLSKLDQLCIAKQITAGMQYLYEQGYDHRQLCTKNCMISKNMVVKVANFGLRATRPNTSYGALSSIEKNLYPVRWLPFESVTSGIFTDTTDVWSFGIVLWEIYSHGITPYYGMNNDEVIALIREGDILPCPKECPREMYDIMQDCWNLVTNERPSFRLLHEKISALVTGVAV